MAGKPHWTFFPFSTLPAPCSIVWCRFPYVEDVDKPGPKSRPAIIKRAFADQDGQPWVQLAYGTTKEVFRSSLDDFTVANLAEMDACGLFCATRFRLDRVATVPWADEFFKDAPSRDTPVMGRLSDHGVNLLRYQAALATKRDQQDQGNLGV
jgi:hypothetical protein